VGAAEIVTIWGGLEVVAGAEFDDSVDIVDVHGIIDGDIAAEIEAWIVEVDHATTSEEFEGFVHVVKDAGESLGEEDDIVVATSIVAIEVHEGRSCSHTEVEVEGVADLALEFVVQRDGDDVEVKLVGAELTIFDVVDFDFTLFLIFSARGADVALIFEAPVFVAVEVSHFEIGRGIPSKNGVVQARADVARKEFALAIDKIASGATGKPLIKIRGGKDGCSNHFGRWGRPSKGTSDH